MTKVKTLTWTYLVYVSYFLIDVAVISELFTFHFSELVTDDEAVFPYTCEFPEAELPVTMKVWIDRGSVVSMEVVA